MPMVKPISLRLDDDASERVRRSHEVAIQELQSQPFTGAVIIPVVLKDGVATTIAHTLGRPPVFVRESAPRGSGGATPLTAGLVEEVRTAGQDRSKVVVLIASGYGQAITVDVVFA